MPPTISTPVTIFEKVYIDVMVIVPPSRKYKYIVCARDDLTRVLEASPLTENKSCQLAKFFWTKIYCQYGAIGYVVTDNGPEIKEAFKHLMKRMNIPHVKISTYNKTGTGAVEHSHFILQEAIVKACPKQRNGEIKNWHKYIDIAVFADQVTTSSVTGYTPYYLLHGVEPLLPIDLVEATFMVEGLWSGISTEDLLALRIWQLSHHPNDLSHAAEMLKKARVQSCDQFMQRYKQRLQKSEYKTSELVLVQNSQLEMTINRFKTDPRYLGPYEVVRRTYGGAYKLWELDGTEMSRSVATFWLLPYVTQGSSDFYKLIGKREETDNLNADDHVSEMSEEGDNESDIWKRNIHDDSWKLSYKKRVPALNDVKNLIDSSGYSTAAFSKLKEADFFCWVY